MKFLLLLFAAAAGWICCGKEEEAGWTNFNPERKTSPAARLLWKEDFLSEDALTLSCREGAEGRIERLPSVGGCGKLRIVKTNDRGYLVVTAKKTLTAAPGTELQTSVCVESRNSNPNYALGFLRLYGRTEELSYFKKLDGRGGGGPKMHQIANTPAGGKERKLAHFLVTEESGPQIHAAIVVAGMPGESVWSNWIIEDFKAAKKAWQERPRSRNAGGQALLMQDLKEFQQKLAAEKEHTAKIEIIDGASRLLVDEKIVPPVLYHAAADDAGNFYGQDFDRSNIHLMCLRIRFGHTPKRAGIWFGKDRFDAEAGADKAERAMRQCPDSCFWLSLDVSPYPDFVKDYPSEAWILDNGRKAYGNHAHLFWESEDTVPRGSWHWVSMHSQVWRDSVAGNLLRLVAELKARGLDKRIIGIHLSGLHDAQFSTRKLDYGVPVQKGFPAFLKEKYGSLQKLNESWGSSFSDFSEIELPRFGENEMLTPGRDQAQIDFLVYLQNNAFRQQEYWAHILKKAFGKPIVIARWCQGAWNGDYVNAYDIDAFLESKDVDVFVSQQSYGLRSPALGCGIAVPHSSFTAHKKLWLSEFDLRTYAALSGGESEIRVTGLSQAVDDVMWQSIHHKMAGMPISVGHGFWYYDMAARSGGWFRPEPILRDIASVQEIHQRLLKEKPTSWHPDVAFVSDEEGMMLCNMGRHYYNSTENQHNASFSLLASSGVPIDHWSLRDLLKNQELAEKYKVLVFRSLYYIDAPRKALLESLRNSGRTLIYLAGTGQLGGIEATGFDVVQKPRPARQVVFSADKVNQTSSLQILQYTRSLTGKNPFLQPPRFSVKRQEGDIVRAFFADDGSPATVERRRDTHTSVYLGAPGSLTPEFFLELVRRANAFCICDEVGVQANVSGIFLSLHSLITGTRTIRLPRRGIVRNLKTGKESPEPLSEISLECEAGTSYWFEIK